VRYDQIRRIPTNRAHAFGWLARDGYPDPDEAAPELVVAWPDGEQTYSLAAVRPADTVTAVSVDGYEITISTGPEQPGHTLRGQILQYGGEVWIDGGADYQGPGRVIGLVSQTSLAAATTGTAVLRLASPLPVGGVVSQITPASGSITVGTGAAAAAVPSLGITIAGVTYELDTLGGGAPGYAGTLVDVESAPGVRCSDAVLASRIAARITTAGIGVTATADGLVVTLTAGHNVTVILSGDDSSRFGSSSLTGATPSWRVRWLAHTATLLAGHVGTEPTRALPVRWTVGWVRMTGADLPGVETLDQGLIHTSHAPFSTGLTDEGLFRYVPALRSLVPAAQTSWAEQRQAAEDALLALLAPELPADRYVDDVPGPTMLRAHALLTVVAILEGDAAQGIDRGDAIARFADEAAREVKAQLARLVWLDDGDGQVEDGETGRSNKPAMRAAWTTESDTVARRPRASTPWTVR